jgi:hypothetical protein
MLTVRSFRRRHKVLKSGTGQTSLASLKRLVTSPVVWRRGRPKNAFRVKQVWIAASRTGGRATAPATQDSQPLHPGIKADPQRAALL